MIHRTRKVSLAGISLSGQIELANRTSRPWPLATINWTGQVRGRLEQHSDLRTRAVLGVDGQAITEDSLGS